MPTIVVRRDRDWGALMRAMKIHVDADEYRLRRGGEVRAEVSPGQHRVRATMDWSGSPTACALLEDGDVLALQAHWRPNPVATAARPWKALVLKAAGADQTVPVRFEQTPWTRRQLVSYTLVAVITVACLWAVGWVAGRLSG